MEQSVQVALAAIQWNDPRAINRLYDLALKHGLVMVEKRDATGVELRPGPDTPAELVAVCTAHASELLECLRMNVYALRRRMRGF